MCNDSAASLLQVKFGFGLRSRQCFSVEVPEAHIECAKWLQLEGAPGGVAKFPSVLAYQIFDGNRRPHGHRPVQTPNPLGSKHSLAFCDKQWLSLQLGSSVTCAGARKSAKYVPVDVHRSSKDIISALPDELLCHIFHFLGTAQDRLACASVSKRWLMLQSHMPRGAFVTEASCVEAVSTARPREVCKDSVADSELQDAHQEISYGHLSRCLSGHKASDVRLAAIALGTESRGGLGKLCIRGGSSATGLKPTVTNLGLSAIGAWCSGLQSLSLWNCSFVDDEGLAAIGKGCSCLEKIDLYKCPLVGNLGVQVVAKSCPLLSFMNLDECEKVGNDALVAVAEHCPNLLTLNVHNCPGISDYGIAKAVHGLKRLKKLNLGGLKLTDESLIAIGLWAGALSRLTLLNLDLVSPDGFIFFGKAVGMQSLKYLHIINCRNFTDSAFEMVGKHCQTLKHMSLDGCEKISDKGLIIFMNIAPYVQVLRLEKCNQITGTGLVTAMSGRGKELKELQVKKCEGLRNVQAVLSHIPYGTALETICVADCPGVSDLLVALIGLLCPEASSIDFSGLTNITDDGLLAFLCGSRKLLTLKLSGCVNVTDRAVCAIVNQCGQDLKTLALDGCKGLSDLVLKAIAAHCPFLEELDVAECAITDAGMKVIIDKTGLVLTSLNLSGCGAVTDRILSFIYKNCDSLQDLNIKNCIGFSDEGISYFESKMWNCTVLH